MAIVLVAAPVVTALATWGSVAAAGGTLLASTALSMTLSYAAGALQPKAHASGGETAGRLVSVSNTGTDARIVILGTFRDAGTLVYHSDHGDQKTKITQVIQVCDAPIDAYLGEIIEGELTPLVPNESQTVKGHESGGTGFNFGDTPTPDAQDWVPPIGHGGHGDIWRQSPAGPNGPLWKLRGKKWEELQGATFHDLNTVPSNALGSNGDVAINRTTGRVYIKRGGFWREKARTPATAGANDPHFLEGSNEPSDHNRFLHWEDNDRRWRWHFKVRYYDGTQTSADSFLQAVASPPSDWDSSYKGLGRAYKVVTQRYYPNIYTGAFPVQTASIIRGVLAYDPRRAATGSNVNWFGTTVKSDQIAWTDNAALLAAYILCWTELPGAVPYAEIDEPELIASANICDQTITNPDGTTEKRYTVNGLVQSTETRDSVLEAFEIALGGHIFRHAGKYVIWAGRARNPTATFTAKNIVGTEYSYQPGPALRERKNTVVGTWFSPAQNYAQISMSQHRNATFFAADKNIELVESVHFRFAAKSRFTPRRQAKIWLMRHRYGNNSITLDLDAEALDVRENDVIEITEGFIGFDTTRFVVQAKSAPLIAPPDSDAPLTVRCVLTAYDPNQWDAPTENPTEEDPDLPAVRDLTDVTAPASIAVDTITARPAVAITGQLLANVSLLVGSSPDLRAAEYEIQYRMSPENFVSPASDIWGTGSEYADEREWASVTKVPNAEKAVFRVPIKSIFDGAYYDFRVRAMGLGGASSDVYEEDDWTRQIDAYLVSTGRQQLPGQPISGGFSKNDLTGGGFEDRGQNWDLIDESTPLAVTTQIVINGAVGSRKGPHILSVNITGGGSDGDRARYRNTTQFPVEPGEIRTFWVFANTVKQSRYLINCLWYDEDDVLLRSDTMLNVQTAAGETGAWILRQIKAQVPGDIDVAFGRLQIVAERTAGATLPQQFYFDWAGTKDRRRISSPGNQGELVVTGDSTWRTLAERDVWVDGFTAMDVDATCKAYVRATGTLNNAQRAEVRLVRVSDADPENTGLWVVLEGAQEVVELASGATNGQRTQGRIPGPITTEVPASLLPGPARYRIRLQGRIKSDIDGGANAEAVFTARRVQLEPQN
jgi:hypothetical protein